MRVSGRKLRLAVGTGAAALMLILGVSSVGATAPAATGGILVIGTGSGVSAYHSTNPATTVTTFRDAVAVTRGTVTDSLGGGKDDCEYVEVGDNSNAKTTSSKDVSGCGELILQPSAYPLWLVVGGPGVGPSGKYFVVPQTENPRNGTLPQKAYVTETFR
jgi:hypothetical protein